MKLTANIFLISIAMVQVVRAVNHVVSVAPSGSFTYSPNSVMAAVGDTIEFQFESNNHSVAQAAFSNPCQPLAGGIWSGFVITTGSESSASTTTQGGVAGYKRQATTPSFTVTVNDTNPAFFYCAQIGHCQLGMVFAINPSANETVNAFQSGAGKSTTIVPSEPSGQGGVLSTTGSSATSTASSPSPTAQSSGSSNVVNVILLLVSVAAIFMV